MAPPGTPPERVEALRSAFLATMKDPDFVAETKKLRLTIDPIPGERLAQVIADIYKTPKEVVKRVGDIVGRVSK